MAVNGELTETASKDKKSNDIIVEVQQIRDIFYDTTCIQHVFSLYPAYIEHTIIGCYT
jgi:hypothetical protein